MTRKRDNDVRYCSHYRGTVEKTCKAGVDLRELVGGPDLGWATRLPCYDFAEKKPNGPVVKCERFAEPTSEELAAEEAAIEAACDRMEKAATVVQKIKADNRGKNAGGVVECPVCGGKLHWSHAACNGHVWGKCETDGCLAWME